MKYFYKKLSPLEYDDINLIEAFNFVVNSKSAWVTTPNIDGICKLFQDKNLISICSGANLILNDSRVFQIITKVFFKKIKNVVRGSDLTSLIIKNTNKKKILIFGNKVNLNKLYKINNNNEYYQIEATFNKNDIKKDCENILVLLNSNKIDILFLCGGFPYSEKIASTIYKKTKNLKILCVGNSINFLIGDVKRSPKFISNLGLEWLYRAINEPRLIKRYIGNLKYFFFIFINKN